MPKWAFEKSVASQTNLAGFIQVTMDGMCAGCVNGQSLLSTLLSQTPTGPKGRQGGGGWGRTCSIDSLVKDFLKTQK